VPAGSYTVDQVLCRIGAHEIKLYQRWRPAVRVHSAAGWVSGVRSSPASASSTRSSLSRGRHGRDPGGFGTGKTITQHALAKWADADIIVYVGCGERGNEMTQYSSISRP